MRSVVLLIIGLLLAAVTCAASFVHGPYSGSPSRDAITISWSYSPPHPGRIEYGPRAVYESRAELPHTVLVAAAEADRSRPTTHVRLEGLKPATEYVYQVVLTEGETEIASQRGYFSTEPQTGEPVSFVVLADTQWQWEGINRLEMVGDAIASDSTRFDFILHAGDVVESPATPYWDHWFSSFDDMLLVAPFIPVLGNHERNHRSYYEAFVFPPGAGKDDERWWALHWGDVVVVGLDSNESRIADYYAQQDWAWEHLSGPEPHKFVVFHHPVFSSDAYHGSGYSYDVIYHPIFVEHGVDIVFNGHAHNYERLERDGVTYLVAGGGGATPRALAEEHVPESLVAIEGHHFYARVTAARNGISVDIVSVGEESVDGGALLLSSSLLDSFSLPRVEEELPQVAWVLLAVLVAGAAVAAILLRLTAD